VVADHVPNNSHVLHTTKINTERKTGRNGDFGKSTLVGLRSSNSMDVSITVTETFQEVLIYKSTSPDKNPL